MRKINCVVAGLSAAAVLSIVGMSAASAGETAPASDGWKNHLPKASCLCFTWP